MFDAVVGGHRRLGRPRTHWKDHVEEALISNGVTNWRRRTQSRSAWNEALRQAETRPKNTAKHGDGSIMVYASGVGPLVKIKGAMKGEAYRDILIRNLSGEYADNFRLCGYFSKTMT